MSIKSKLLTAAILGIIILIGFEIFYTVNEDFYDMWSIKSIEQNDKEILNYFMHYGSNVITFYHDGTCHLPTYLREYANDETKGVWILSGLRRDNLKIMTSGSFFNTTFKVVKFDRLNLILENQIEKKRVICFRL